MWRRKTLIAAVVGVALAAALVAILLWQRDDDDDVSTETTTAPTTATSSSTTASTTTSTTDSTTTSSATPPAVDPSTAVFPYASSGVRYDDAVAAARGFAIGFVGFTDPLVGELMPGDARSGEVEIRPVADDPVTTVFIRQLGPDDSWWVLGSATANITTDRPGPGEAISSPVTVAGSALAFEGHVDVEIRQDGSPQPIGSGFVTGGGDSMRPFEGQIQFSVPSQPYGAIVFVTRSAEDDRVWEAAVLRVRFA
jgi:hypothetical protein